MSVSLPRLMRDIGYVSTLPDKVVGDAQKIKATIDQAGQDIQGFLNDELVPGIEEAIEDLFGDGGGGPGTPGPPGATFVPSVDDQGTQVILSWSNDGDLENPPPVNIRGPEGASGNGIQSVSLISGDHSPGTYDTYRITFTDGSIFDFAVYNGANGSGSGGSGGADGATFTPSVSADGVISWTNNKGLANPDSVNIKGPAGPNEVSTDTASSITGIIKGSDGKLSAAAAGTDYLAPGAKGTANGLASLDANSKLSPEQASARIVSVTTSKTLALTDAGSLQKVEGSSAQTITIPTNSSAAFPTGTEIEILRYGSGSVTIEAASGVTIRCAEEAHTIAKQYGGVSLKKLDTNEWLLMGNLG